MGGLVQGLNSDMTSDQPASALPADAIASALQAGHPQEAERLTRAYLATAPRDEDALVILGICLQEQGRAAEAVEPYRQLTRMQPQSATYWNNLGTVLRSAGQMLESEQAYRRALELDPADYSAAMNRGLFFCKPTRSTRRRPRRASTPRRCATRSTAATRPNNCSHRGATGAICPRSSRSNWPF
jgi:Flp pilus assembly protein TadD